MSALPLDAMLPKPRITGRRAAPRARLFVPAEVLLLQGLEKCLLDDLSQHGARITLGTHMPRPGSGVVLQIEDLDAFGTVIWVNGQRFGLQFEDTLPLPQVVLIRHYADAYPAQEAARNARNLRTFGPGRPALRSFG
jgi:hypothetical protein